jgi:Protein of unknown function, DUF481
MRNLALTVLILVASQSAFAQQPPAPPSPPPPPSAPAATTPPAGFKDDPIFSAPPTRVDERGWFVDPVSNAVWKGGFDLGLNGSTGNSEVFNIRFGANADRKSETNLLHADLLYTLGKQDGRTIQNAMLFNARDEVLFPGSRWTFFGSTNIEYDELRAYKFRVGVYAGVGYTVRDDGATLFKVRAGAGAVREIGGPQDRWVPELVFGYDYKHKFSDRAAIVSTLDFYPRIDDFGQYRVRGNIAFETILDPATGTNFKIGAQSRYDSDPGPNTRRHDLNYFATLGVKF